MDSRLAFFGGLGLGVGLLYGIELARDAERRARARARWSRVTSLLAVLRSRASVGSLREQVLVEQVRSEIDHLLARPHAIEVRAAHGYVTLAGAIHDDEVEPVLARVAQLPGVKGVDSHLVIVESSAGRSS
jgi:hypothetical protein